MRQLPPAHTFSGSPQVYRFIERMNQEFYYFNIDKMEQNYYDTWRVEHFQRGEYLNAIVIDWLEKIYDQRIQDLILEFKDDPEHEEFH